MPKSASGSPNFPHGDRPLIKTATLTHRPTEAAHALLREHLNSGDRVIDATLGNGHDTIFLAKLVGPTGWVYSFDIQSDAIESAQQKLLDLSVEHLSLHHAGHENMADLVKAPVQAVMFNLGYLPGGDKQVITQSETTLKALAAAVDLLSPKGIVTIVAYIGHPGGQEEADAVTAFCRKLEPSRFAVTIHKSPADKPTAPFLISINRR